MHRCTLKGFSILFHPFEKDVSPLKSKLIKVSQGEKCEEEGRATHQAPPPSLSHPPFLCVFSLSLPLPRAQQLLRTNKRGPCNMTAAFFMSLAVLLATLGEAFEKDFSSSASGPRSLVATFSGGGTTQPTYPSAGLPNIGIVSQYQVGTVSISPGFSKSYAVQATSSYSRCATFFSSAPPYKPHLPSPHSPP